MEMKKRIIALLIAIAVMLSFAACGKPKRASAESVVTKALDVLKTLDEDQINLRDKIWDPNIDAVFVDSPAGTGKSLVSIATAHLMREYGRYTDMVYVMHPVGDPQGALPGSITEKMTRQG